MWGVLDRLYAFYEIGRLNQIQKQNFKPEIKKHNSEKEIWICFVPVSVSSDSIFRRGILPEKGVSIIYTINSIYMIKSDSKKTISNLDKIYNDAIMRLKGFEKKGYSINLLGVSLGNIFSIRLASEVKNLGEIVSIVGGANLGASAFGSVLTSRVLEKCTDSNKYRRDLSAYDPIRYVPRINAKSIILRLGKMDRLIPFNEGKKLAESFLKIASKKRIKIDYKFFRWADHCSSMFFYSLECLAKKHL